MTRAFDAGKHSTAPLYLPILLVSLPLAFLHFGLPIYDKELGASALAIGGLFSALTITMVVLRPAIGWGLDRFGRKRFFVGDHPQHRQPHRALAGRRADAGLRRCSEPHPPFGRP